MVGYSGHALVCAEIFQLNGCSVVAYFDSTEKIVNPHQLKYLGIETELKIKEMVSSGLHFFVAIADNQIRSALSKKFLTLGGQTIAAIHPSASVSTTVVVSTGSFIGNHAIINPFVTMGVSVIVNTGAIVEHESILGDFAHIAPGSVICGNVKIGSGTFIGANSTVKQGIEIGANCVVGAGSLVLENIPDNEVWYGSPSRRIK